MQYDAAKRMTDYFDPLNHHYVVGYDQSDNAVSVTNPLGFTAYSTYDLDYELLTSQDELGRQTNYTYNSRGWVTQVTEAVGTPVQRTSYVYYDPVGNVIQTTDPRGTITQASYDSLNQLTTLYEAVGLSEMRVRHFQYNAVGDMTGYTDPRGNVWQATYDQLDRPTQVTDPMGFTVSAAYDAVGNVTGVTNQLGNTWTAAYDGDNRPTQITDPLGGTIAAGYDANGNVVSMTNQNGVTTNASYDQYDRVTGVTEAAGTAVQRSYAVQYDNNDNVTGYTDPRGNVWTASYDALDRPVSYTNPLGNTWSTVYDPVGNPIQQSDPLGDTWVTQYDALNRPTTETNPLGFSTTIGYDANDNTVSLTDADGNTTSWVHDALNRVTQDTNQLGFSRYYSWDTNDNLTQEIDRNGRTRQWVYDANNRMTSETWVNGNYTQSRNYDAAGKLTSISDPSSSYAYLYDPLGRVTGIDNAGTPGAPHVVQAQAYDPAGNRTQLSQTVNGAADFTNNYQFNALNELTQITQSGANVANKRVDMSYNPNGQIATINRYSDLGGTQLAAASAYNYDAANQLTSLDHTRANGSTIAAYGYQYDTAGRMTQMTSPDGTANYVNDASGQLTDAYYSFQAAEHFTWDPNGNRIGAGYVVGVDNQLLSDGVNNYQYDNEGNRISQTNIATGAVTNYQWDFRNRVTEVTQHDDAGNTTMDMVNTYDVLDRRIQKDVSANSSTVSQHFVYNGLGLSEIYDGSGSLTNRYLQGPGLDNVFADEQFRPGLQGGQNLWTLGDHLGSVRDVVDNSGVVQKHEAYSAFGQTTADTNPAVKENFGFTGNFTDKETGFLNRWKRPTDPQTATFVTPDPMGFSAGDPNLYRDVGNRPTQLRDPTGLTPFPSMMLAMPPEASGGPSSLVTDLNGNPLGSFDEYWLLYLRQRAKEGTERRWEHTVMAAQWSYRFQQDNWLIFGLGRALCPFSSDPAPSSADELARQMWRSQVDGKYRSRYDLMSNDPEKIREYLGPKVPGMIADVGLLGLEVLGFGGILNSLGGLGSLGMPQVAGSQATVGLGTRIIRFFWDPRPWKVISNEYWAGGAAGRSLHHWFFSQSWRWVPQGLRNAGCNLLQTPAWRVYGRLTLNTWMGFTKRWSWQRYWQQKVTALAVENGIRFTIPGSIFGAGYIGYEIGDWLDGLFNDPPAK